MAAAPCLVVEGLGPIGLPLSTVEACRLRSVCRRAPFGKGERTIVDTEVRDTWELDPQNFTFASPAWDRWINDVALPKVCEGLGVSTTPSSPPRAELYKLLLYETGSQYVNRNHLPWLLPDPCNMTAFYLIRSRYRVALNVSDC